MKATKQIQETFSWDAAFNVSKQETIDFANHLLELANYKQKETLPFEIADKFTEKHLYWDKAVEYVKTLGDGWRLPTKDELDLIYESENDFEQDNYWSNSQWGTYDSWKQNFADGEQDYKYKTANFYVRAIKDI